MNVTKEHLDNAERLFGNEKGYDHKSILNKSTKTIPKNFWEECKTGITLEYLAKLGETGLPILKYRTQITIHGNFEEPHGFSFQTYYKSMFVNKNGSLGVRYSAIDAEKKSRIRNRLSNIRKGWSLCRDSTGDNLMRIYYKKEEMLAEYNRISKLLEGVICSCDVLWAGMFGMGWVNISLCAIPETRIDQLIFDLTGMTKEEEEKKNEADRIQNEIDQAEMKKRWAIERERENQIESEWKVNCGMAQFNFSQWDGTTTILVKYSPYDTAGAKFVIHKKTGKVVFRKWDSYKDRDGINFRLHGLTVCKGEYFIKEVFLDKAKVLEPKATKQETDIQVIDYSEKAVVVKGNTRPIKDKLAAMGGRFNKFLTDPVTKEKFAGWIFPAKRKAELIKIA